MALLLNLEVADVEMECPERYTGVPHQIAGGSRFRQTHLDLCTVVPLTELKFST